MKTDLGIIVENLAASQLSFLAIENINRYLENHPFEVSPTLFFESQTHPCLPPKCARYHIKDAAHLYGNLIATSFHTLMCVKNFTRSKIFFYVQDIEWERSWFRYPPEIVITTMKDPNIIKFTRSLDYTNKLKQDGFRVGLDDRVVEDFDIPQILEIVNDYSTT